MKGKFKNDKVLVSCYNCVRENCRMKSVKKTSAKNETSKKKSAVDKKKNHLQKKTVKKEPIHQPLTEEDDIYWAAFEANPIGFVKWSVEKFVAESRKTLRRMLLNEKKMSAELKREVVETKDKKHKIWLYEKLMFLEDFENLDWHEPEISVMEFIDVENLSGINIHKMWFLRKLMNPGGLCYLNALSFYNEMKKRFFYSGKFYTYPYFYDVVDITPLERFNGTFVSWRPLLKLVENKFGSLKDAIGVKYSKVVKKGEPMTERRLKDIAEKMGTRPEDLYEAELDGAAVRMTVSRVKELGKQSIKDLYKEPLSVVCADLCARYAKALGYEDSVWEFDEKDPALEWLPIVFTSKKPLPLELPENVLGLPSRVVKSINQAGIKTVKDFCLMSEKIALKTLKGCGKRSFPLIKSALNECGLSFGMKESDFDGFDIFQEQRRAEARKISLERLGLSHRVCRVLRDNKIDNVVGLLCTTKSELSKLNGVGEGVIQEIDEKLKKHKLTIGMCVTVTDKNKEDDNGN